MKANIVFKDGENLIVDVPDDLIDQLFAKLTAGDVFIDQTGQSGIWIPKESIRVVWLHRDQQTSTETTKNTPAALDNEVANTDTSTQTTNTDEAPYGYKADGTPRKKPGRVAKKHCKSTS